MLRKIRITIATLVMTAITLLLLDFTGVVHHYLGWVARLQFMPALLSLNVLVLLTLVLLTLVFGRVYCSVICPLGIMQDMVSSLRRKKHRFRYNKAVTWLRRFMVAVMVVAFVAGIGSLVALLDPYGNYGRIATNLLQPLWLAGNNVLASIAAHYESYSFYSVDVWVKSVPTLIVAMVVFVLVATLAWRSGRTYCNTICPVGTVLGQLARLSWLKIRIDTDKCISCGLCARDCKASCIDSKNHAIDYSRCVTCGNCLSSCNHGALRYGTSVAATDKPVNEARRAALVGAAIVAADVAFAQTGKKLDGGLAVIENKKQPKRRVPLTPPGSLGASNMASHCTACQLCVAACPNGVLRPSDGLLTLMQPTMSYERGYCRPECNRCSQVCPNGAIKPISHADKSVTHIGQAVWIKQNCVVLADGVSCGNCARHCPAEAIMMLPLDPNDNLSPMVPHVDVSRCIGCGACEYVCPARPFSAIYVEGLEVHHV